jgi:hypothetical protein
MDDATLSIQCATLSLERTTWNLQRAVGDLQRCVDIAKTNNAGLAELRDELAGREPAPSRLVR